MAALKRLVFIFVFLERALVCIQSLIDDNLDFRSLGVGVVVVLDFENQRRFAFLEAFEVESPAAFKVDVENLFVADIPAERMFVVARARDFFLVFVEELYVNVSTHAVGIDFEARELGIFFAAVDAVERVPFGGVEPPAFDFEVFVLFGGSGVAVAASGEDESENGECQELEFFHFFYPFCTNVQGDSRLRGNDNASKRLVRCVLGE